MLKKENYFQYQNIMAHQVNAQYVYQKSNKTKIKHFLCASILSIGPVSRIGSKKVTNALYASMMLKHI